ncbi:MAG TPA: DUF1816 domain-containing protein [Leptolyngbyaceae cyanobacterium M65_K2018_010]|nr:DUF1816 domain-containing protein [Leptolyngbyaceae cyanobacterium M65_K2018_010]
MKTSFGRFFENLLGFSKAWWIEIKTSQPACTYYFGPFSSEAEAESMKGGYIEDLEQEGAQNIRWVIQRCSHPDQLTITEEWDSPLGGFSSPVLSGQS